MSTLILSHTGKPLAVRHASGAIAPLGVDDHGHVVDDRGRMFGVMSRNGTALPGQKPGGGYHTTERVGVLLVDTEADRAVYVDPDDRVAFVRRATELFTVRHLYPEVRHAETVETPLPDRLAPGAPMRTSGAYREGDRVFVPARGVVPVPQSLIGSPIEGSYVL